MTDREITRDLHIATWAMESGRTTVAAHFAAKAARALAELAAKEAGSPRAVPRLRVVGKEAK
jgi:hypothetical protein